MERVYRVRSGGSCSRRRAHAAVFTSRGAKDSPRIRLSYNTYEYLRRGIGGYSGMPAHIEIRRGQRYRSSSSFFFPHPLSLSSSLHPFPPFLSLSFFPFLFSARVLSPLVLLRSTLPFDRITGARHVPGSIEPFLSAIIRRDIARALLFRDTGTRA